MIDFLNSFKSLIKLERIHTDNNVFKLHYKFTVIMLIVFSILLTSKQYFGEPIDCDVDSHKYIVDTYCWIYGTFIYRLKQKDVPLPEPKSNYKRNERTTLPPWMDRLNPRMGDEILWQKYYQWVCIVFCFQALLFYLPRYLWKTWEGGRLRLLVKDLSGPLVTPNWNSMTKETLITYLMSGKYSHNIYAIRYAMCELLNAINVIGQIYLMDWFLTGNFSLYGLAVSSFNMNNNGQMDEVFPKLTKCTYYRGGASGTPESRDALCVLPLNVLNEKLFLVLWFWLLFLTGVSILAIVYRLFVLFVPKVRIYLLMAQTRSIDYKQSRMIVNEITYGDFFLLYNVGKNVNPIIYRELIMGIHEYMQQNRKNYQAFNTGCANEV